MIWVINNTGLKFSVFKNGMTSRRKTSNSEVFTRKGKFQVLSPSENKEFPFFRSIIFTKQYEKFSRLWHPDNFWAILVRVLESTLSFISFYKKWWTEKTEFFIFGRICKFYTLKLKYQNILADLILTRFSTAFFLWNRRTVSCIHLSPFTTSREWREKFF